MPAFLDSYEPLDIIGNGSFGIIRKVKRKSDGMIFARKELNFERMSERDRKQIVSEVNILKDLNHEHIVRYHDRHVDRDAGILYIIMEYCGGGDLSTVIKQATKQSRPIPEDIIWHFFMQILLALCHCHHPNGHGRSGSGSGSALYEGDERGSRRPQILHRDLKPENVFLDEDNNVKLGDFGLSKALNQASFANTYVGTPYYMSPELMQEKAYDSKSDIWSLGCLIYELCALKPPFHEAKTHSELSILIRNGRIPPLPRGYSNSLFGVIKAMLNLNPAMRPSAAQLLQHERLELVFKVDEAERMLSTVKAHKTAISARERDLVAREQAAADKERHLTAVFAQKDGEISNLQCLVSQLQLQIRVQASKAPQVSQADVDAAVKRAVTKREEELRVLVSKREQEVAEAVAKREGEIMDAVRRREAQVCEAWTQREAEIREEVEMSIKAVEERILWIQEKELELAEEDERLDAVRQDLKRKMCEYVEGPLSGGGRSKPLLSPDTPESIRRTRRRLLNSTPQGPTRVAPMPVLQTPITRPAYTDHLPSAMKGVILTSTGEILSTPTPAEIVNLFNESPRVGFNFGKVFEVSSDEEGSGPGEDDTVKFPLHEDGAPESPTLMRKSTRGRTDSSQSHASIATTSSSASSNAPPSRLRRPSLRKTGTRTRSGSTSASVGTTAPESYPSSASSSVSSSVASSACSSVSSVSTAATSDAGSSCFLPQAKPLSHPHLTSISTTSSSSQIVAGLQSPPKYNFADEENLPSPFIKRAVPLPSHTSQPSIGPSTSSATVTSSTAKPILPSSTSAPAIPNASVTMRVIRKRPSLRSMGGSGHVRGKSSGDAGSSSGGSAISSVTPSVGMESTTRRVGNVSTRRRESVSASTRKPVSRP
ncbi:kinase-like protein [Coprinopsis sp. MPI-PUGE-AT-0042]|nr:kinase-like protein [Coprinopsis sp. MPI-PUGE-AT-0042]